MSSPTTNFGWLKPTVGGDNDIWGDYLNTNLNDQDSLIRRFMNAFIGPSAPTEAEAGTVWLNNTVNPWVYSIYDGVAWVSIGSINSTTHNFAPSGIGISFYPGDTKVSAQTTNHGGWLLCNGQAVSTTTYSALFALIGYAFGGSGATFLVPDMRGRVPGVIGSGSGLTTRFLGDTVGEETHTLTIPEIPAHTHFIASDDSAPFVGSVLTNTNQVAKVGPYPPVSDSYQYYLQGVTSAATVGLSGSTGGGGAHNNMQPTLFVGNYFIYAGI